MSDRKIKNIFKSISLTVVSFLLFFVTVGGVVTATFYVFFSRVTVSEEDIRLFAPAVFVNVIFLSVIFLVIDKVRRTLTVDRPSKKIKNVLKRLSEGDFSARISEKFIMDADNNFASISESINLLAKELSGVETLRNDFVANVSHELKTPLAVMQNYGTMLQDPELDNEQRMEYAKAVTNACRRLAHLVTNILKLNKLENQQLFPSVKEYDLSEQLCQCLLTFEDIWEQKQLNIETEIDDGVLIRSDEELLSLVWSNLFSNAVKFTDKGGTVFVSLKSDNDSVTVTVTDTGCGMTPEVGLRIFDKFYQGDTSHATQGNGLGLALVKRVVDIMQGEITVQSAVGKGSTFTVKFQL